MTYGDIKTTLTVMIFPVEKETPRGYWVQSYWRVPLKEVLDEPTEGGFRYWHKRRWVRKGSHKKYAASTIEDAFASFMARKRKQIAILESQLRRAVSARDTATALISVSA